MPTCNAYGVVKVVRCLHEVVNVAGRNGFDCTMMYASRKVMMSIVEHVQGGKKGRGTRPLTCGNSECQPEGRKETEACPASDLVAMSMLL